MISLDEFIEQMANRPGSKGDGLADDALIQRRLVDFTVQAAVSAEKLTANPEWDRFLSYLQASLERANAERQSVIDKLIETHVLDPQSLALLKIRQAWLDGVRHALNWAMVLPKQLVENGEAARDLDIPS